MRESDPPDSPFLLPSGQGGEPPRRWSAALARDRPRPARALAEAGAALARIAALQREAARAGFVVADDALARPRLATALIGLPGGERRRHPRWTCRIACEIMWPEGAVETVLADIGNGGALAPALGIAGLFQPGAVSLRLGDGGTAAIRAMPDQHGRTHIAFGTGGETGFGERLAESIMEVAAETEVSLWQAGHWAGWVEDRIERGVRDGEVAEADLFGGPASAKGRSGPPETHVARFDRGLLAALLAAMAEAGEAPAYGLVTPRFGTPRTPMMPAGGAAIRLSPDHLNILAGDIGALLAARWRPVANTRTVWLADASGSALWLREAAAPLRVFGRPFGALRLGLGV